MYKQGILFERLHRQGLLTPIENRSDEEAYIQLFRALQPVAPVHFTRPGEPPKLVHRTNFDDSVLAGQMRETNQIVKGRFLGGRVGYVLQEDLNMYATVFRKPLTKAKPIHDEIMETIRGAGGISKEQLKEILPISGGEVSKELQRMQEAFLVYEVQMDTDWDTGWFEFSTEWFEIKEDQDVLEHHTSLVILNFIKAFVFATVGQVKSWTQLNNRLIKKTIQVLLQEKKIIEVEIDELGKGYMLVDDIAKICQDNELPKHVFMLDKSDFLVRANIDELKEQYKGHEVLHYLLIDGEFKGVVTGHWRIGPYDIDDVILEIDPLLAEIRREEFIEAIRKIYPENTTKIIKFNGETS